MIPMIEYHQPVLSQESIEALKIKAGGTYVDVTFGGGGHSRGILDQLTEGRLYAFDQDQDARRNVNDLLSRLEDKNSFTFINSNFRHLQQFLRLHDVVGVDGILADLGVSSYQFDQPSRGFTTESDEALDMRMDQSVGRSAKEIVNEYKAENLIHILSAHGEVRNARTLTHEIVRERTKKMIKTGKQLRDIALKTAPKGQERKYLAQVFQAFRIEVNDEMGALKEFLIQAGKVLNKGGRLVVISYHSLEDRLVKNFINKGNFKGLDQKDFYGNPIRIFDPVNRKPIVPSQMELENNNRSRSAKLRIGTKR